MHNERIRRQKCSVREPFFLWLIAQPMNQWNIVKMNIPKIQRHDCTSKQAPNYRQSF